MDYHRKSKPKVRKKDGVYVDLTISDEEAAEMLKNDRKSFTILFDTAEIWEAIPPEYFRDFFFHIVRYCRTFERKENIIEDRKNSWAIPLQKFYEMECNYQDVAADKWIDSQEYKIRGGINSAKKRAENKAQVEDSTTAKTVEAPPPSLSPSPPSRKIPDKPLQQALIDNGKGTRLTLQEYAKCSNLQAPSNNVCMTFDRHKEYFLDWKISHVIRMLNREVGSDELNADMLIQSVIHNRNMELEYCE